MTVTDDSIRDAPITDTYCGDADAGSVRWDHRTDGNLLGPCKI